jgi:hypothetical protein
MRKFKLFFYPVYLIIALLVLYYSIDILANMDAYKEKVDFTMLRKLPQYLLYLLLVVSIFMIAEFITENFHLLTLRRKVRQKERDLLELKARLYDRGQPTTPVPEEVENHEDEEDDPSDSSKDEDDSDDEDEEDYKIS